MKKIFLIAVFSLVFSTSAQAQILIEQGKVVETVQPGETVSGKLVIHNTTDKPMTIGGYWEDFEYAEPYNGNKKFYPAGTIDKSVSSWISFSPKEFSLGPFDKKEVSYTINAPADIKGGYNGVIFFEKDAMDVDSRLGVKIISRVGTLFFIEAVDQNRAASFENLAMEGSTLSGDFTNQGNVILIAEGVFFVMDAEGLAVDRGEVPNIYLPPGKTAKYNVAFNEDLPAGSYNLLLTVDLGEGSTLVKEIDLEKNSSGSVTIKEIRD